MRCSSQRFAASHPAWGGWRRTLRHGVVGAGSLALSLITLLSGRGLADGWPIAAADIDSHGAWQPGMAVVVHIVSSYPASKVLWHMRSATPSGEGDCGTCAASTSVMSVLWDPNNPPADINMGPLQIGQMGELTCRGFFEDAPSGRLFARPAAASHPIRGSAAKVERMTGLGPASCRRDRARHCMELNRPACGMGGSSDLL